MSGTNLYRALVSAGVEENLATAAASDFDDMSTALQELKIVSRITLVVVIAVLVRTFF